MQEDFLSARIASFGIEVIVPEENVMDEINRIIFAELCLGIFTKESKQYFIQVIDDLEKAGAEGIVLGCTEIPLLITQEDIAIPLFETSVIHAKAAVEDALS